MLEPARSEAQAGTIVNLVVNSARFSLASCRMIEAIQLLFAPTRTWEKITRANRGIAATLILYLLPLMLFTTGAESYAMVNWGYQRGQFDQVVVATREQAIRYGLTQFALELAIVIIGGLISSTLLARLVTPVMYKLLPPPVAAAPERATMLPSASPHGAA
jgi:hypothetical protein